MYIGEALSIARAPRFVKLFQPFGHNLSFRNYSKSTMSREATYITSNADWEKHVRSKDGLVLVDFFAEWCGPCRMLEPILTKIASLPEFSHVTFVKADVDQNTHLANEHKIRAVPTLLLFKNGELVREHQGLVNEKGLRDLLTQFA